MIIQGRFIICNQGSTLVGNVDSREMSIRAGGGGGAGLGNSLCFPFNFTVNLKLLLKSII